MTHVSRHTMYQALSKFAPLAHGRALSISRSEQLCQVLSYTPASITPADYPNYDLHRLDFSPNQFDCTAADQVLEHFHGNPATAVAEMFRVTRPGGLVVITSCCLNPIHREDPGDYWRFTPDGLRLLAEPHGHVLEAAGWGNPLVCLWVGLRRHQVPRNPHHPIYHLATTNWPAWPLVVWMVTRKPKETR